MYSIPYNLYIYTGPGSKKKIKGTFYEIQLNFFDSLVDTTLRGSFHNPNTKLSNPSGWLVDWMGGLTSSGHNITPETAVGLPAVWSAVELVSSTIAGLPATVFTTSGDGTKTIQRDHPIAELLREPNRLHTSFIFRELMEAYVLLWGNAYALIERDGAMRATALIPIHPRNVSPQIGKDNKLIYVITNTSEIIDPVNMLHIRGLGFDGVKGKSVIAIARENLGGSIAAQNFGNNFFGKGARLDGVIEYPGQLKKDGLSNLKKTWNETYSGANADRVAVLDGGMKYTSIGVPPEDSQFIETKKFGVTDVARLFRVPPPLLYDLERSSFNNIQELILSYVKFSITPRVINWEQELKKKLVSERDKSSTFVQFNMEGLLRGDIKARGEFYRLMVQAGVYSPNEIRAFETMNPYDGGNDHYIPANMNAVGQIQNEE